MEILDETEEKELQVEAQAYPTTLVIRDVWKADGPDEVKIGMTKREVKRLFEICQRAGLI